MKLPGHEDCAPMRRALILAFCALTLLAACGGQGSLAPFTDSRIPPGLEQRFYPPEGWTWGLVAWPRSRGRA